MGIMIGTRGSGSTLLTLKGPDGTVAGTIRISRPNKTKPKRTGYNFKEISAEILRAATSSSARRAATRASSTVASLRRKLGTSDYDSNELKNALAHARKMEKIARKKIKHLKQEEELERLSKRQGGGTSISIDQPENQEPEPGKVHSQKEDVERKEAELRRQLQEYEKLMQECLEDFEELAESDPLDEELTVSIAQASSPEDIELLKKKHRAKERKEILEADLQYLKALFHDMEKEKQASANTTIHATNTTTTRTAPELSIPELPPQPTEAPAIPTGGGLDIKI